jgi:hypothetical protein
MPSPADQIAAVERDRRKREALLLLALLALAAQARRYIIHSLRDNGTLPDIFMRKLAPIILDAMADAHVAGVRRVGVLAGVELILRGVATDTLPEYEATARVYAPAAAVAARGIRDTLSRLAADAVVEAQRTGRSAVRVVQDAFTRWGWTNTPPQTVEPDSTGEAGWAAQGHATDAILAAYNAGMFVGYDSPEVRGKLTALTHRSVVDSFTSTICRERHNLTLPVDDPYWRSNWNPLHRHCRSVVLPRFGPVTMSTAYPVTVPQPGYGLAPVAAFGVRVGAAA